MKNGKLNRRRFLSGTLGASAITVGLPWLEIFQARAQASSVFPTRFALFCWGNGILPERWIPKETGTGGAWRLSDQLKPLESVKNHLTVVTGCEVKTANIIPHHSGAAGTQTTLPLPPWQVSHLWRRDISQVGVNMVSTFKRRWTLSWTMSRSPA